MRGRGNQSRLVATGTAIAVAFFSVVGTARAQQRPPTAPATEVRETVQADVSTRTVAVTSSFTGVEIVVFGAVDNSRQPSAEAGLYDIVVVVEGTPTRLVARRKSNVAGLWVNTHSITFESVPSYYAIVSTRPLDELADPLVLRENDIGFEYVRMTPIRGWETGVTTAELEDFKSAVVALKQRDGLYIEDQYGVAFIGRSLFRASIDLPANVPVGPLEARIHLFREGRLLSTYRTRVNLRREGLERFLYAAAINYPLLYGLFTVALSVGAGLAASTVFRRSGH
ncbi:MAG TPA: TIGR02186 family protein [Hyphomicrobiaceae bacterium]|nr:TIGR02186 family protein [Hyphomicrobiaceae bacterium]